MASLFDDNGGVDDLFNDALQENQELPSDDDQAAGEQGGDGGDGVPIKFEPKQKRAVRNPRPRLTVETLRGPRGIHTIEDYFKDMKYKGKGHEKQDLDEVLRRMQHWAHRMYPTYKFDDVLTNIERLGKKKPLQVHMSRYRLGLLEPPRIEGDPTEGEDGGAEEPVAADEPFDEFDALLEGQIAMSKLAPRTPAPHRHNAADESSYTPKSTSTMATPSSTFSRGNVYMSTPYLGPTTSKQSQWSDSDLAQPLPPSPPPAAKKLTAEQLARIADNRRLAQERLRLKKLAEQQTQLEMEE